MKIGDVIYSDQLDELPVGSVVVHDEPGNAFNTVTRTPSGFTWVDVQSSNSSTGTYGHGGISVDGWTVVHLPAVPLKVGDVVTGPQADALPVGTVVVDDDETRVAGAPAIKAANGRWLFWDVEDSSPETTNVLVNHRILYIPASADTGAIRTAA